MSQCDIRKAESLILPMLARPDARQRQALATIDALGLNVLKHAGRNVVRSYVAWRYLKWRMTSAARRGQSLRDIETQLRPIFKRMTERVYHSAVLKRAATAYERIKHHLAGERLLDLGAGNGLIAQTIQERTRMTVTLAAVVNYSLTNLPIVIFPQGGRIPLEDASVDTTLIYLVLHHADDPLRLLGEAVRVTRQRLIIMEGYADDDDTHLVNCFFDWFLNRVVQGADINLPLNFQTTAEWRQIFTEHGLHIVQQDVVGIDEPVAPENHVLFVLDRQAC
jgi:ubiquinone/menaquinone biosynthesis C-methylase UbiE